MPDHHYFFLPPGLQRGEKTRAAGRGGTGTIASSTLSLPGTSHHPPGETVYPAPLPAADDFKAFRKQLSRIAQTLEIKGKTHKLFDILHSSAPAMITLPVNEGILNPAKTRWLTPVMLPFVAKRAEKKYQPPLGVPQQFFFNAHLHPTPGSFMVSRPSRLRA